MSIREANALKYTKRCLKCGKSMWTDRCHRICPKCAHENEGVADTKAAMPADIRQLLRGLGTEDVALLEGSVSRLCTVTED